MLSVCSKAAFTESSGIPFSFMYMAFMFEMSASLGDAFIVRSKRFSTATLSPPFCSDSFIACCSMVTFVFGSVCELKSIFSRSSSAAALSPPER